jgi:Na+/proline symporter
VAQELTVPGGTRVKIRSPWGVFFLALVTLGIYYLVWYYKINRELRDFGIGTSPVTSLLAISVGGLIIVPPFVSMWNTLGRIGEAEERGGSPTRISRGLGFLLFVIAFFFLPIELPYMQEHLNQTWRAASSQPQR